jgi:hypothetical protein
MVPVKKETHSAHGNKYELFIYRVEETGEYRIYVAKNGFGVGDVFEASQEIVSYAKKVSGADLVEELIVVAKSDIDRNEFGLY